MTENYPYPHNIRQKIQQYTIESVEAPLFRYALSVQIRKQTRRGLEETITMGHIHREPIYESLML